MGRREEEERLRRRKQLRVEKLSDDDDDDDAHSLSFFFFRLEFGAKTPALLSTLLSYSQRHKEMRREVSMLQSR